MNKKTLGFFSLVLISAIAIQSTVAVQSVSINAAGSTFAEVILSVWGSAFKTATGGNVVLNYGGGGSGQGIASIINGSVDFAGTDAPLNSQQMSQANQNGKVINTIPESAGGIVLAYNIPSADLNGPLNLTGPLIAQIMQRNITSWSDARLHANNLNPGLKDTSDITVVHRSDASGTTYAFSNYLTLAAPNDWVLGSSTTLAWPTATVGAKGNPNVASAIKTTTNAIGYVELAYALSNTISTANIMNKDGKLVNATLAGITAAVNTAVNSLPSSTASWSSVSINNQAGATTYPICTFTYLLVYQDLTSKGNTGAAMVAFFQYIMTSAAQAKSSTIGYVPLPQSLLTKNLAVINGLKLASGANTSDYLPTSSATSSSSGPQTSPGFEVFSVTGLFLAASVVMLVKRKNKMN